jgi:histone-lysine N-methyltransferase SETMAR
MLTIVWDPTEFAVVIALDSGCKFNAGYYVSELLTPLSEWWRERGGGNCGKLIVHVHNARPHRATVSHKCMAENAMVIAADPPYSPDLAHSDFYLLGHVRGLLRGESFELGSDCYRRSRAFWGTSKKSMLTKVFLEWMTRLERCIEINGDYVW